MENSRPSSTLSSESSSIRIDSLTQFVLMNMLHMCTHIRTCSCANFMIPVVGCRYSDVGLLPHFLTLLSRAVYLCLRFAGCACLFFIQLVFVFYWLTENQLNIYLSQMCTQKNIYCIINLRRARKLIIMLHTFWGIKRIRPQKSKLFSEVFLWLELKLEKKLEFYLFTKWIPVWNPTYKLWGFQKPISKSQMFHSSPGDYCLVLANSIWPLPFVVATFTVLLFVRFISCFRFQFLLTASFLPLCSCYSVFSF